MTNTEADIPMIRLIEEAEGIGRDHGKSAASHLEFRDEDTARRCIQLDEDGDPEWYEYWGAPAPLSGEFADSMTPKRLLEEMDLDLDTVTDVEEQEICDAYENAFVDAHRDEVIRLARAAL
jgi:hypothetical protein